MKHTISGLVINSAGDSRPDRGGVQKVGHQHQKRRRIETDLFDTSRFTIVVEGHDKEVKGVTAEIKKVRDVLQIDDLSRQGFLDRELVLRPKCNSAPRISISLTQMGEVFGVRVIAMGKSTITFEIAGEEAAR